MVSTYLEVHLGKLTFRALKIKLLVMKRSVKVAVVEVPLITLVGSFITCGNWYAFMKPVSSAVVLCDVTQPEPHSYPFVFAV